MVVLGWPPPRAANILQEILTALRMGRVTALQKPNGSVRGIVVSDVFRTLVARTMAQQLSPAIERGTSPALSTWAGTECIAHAIQALTDLDPTATVVSIDGIGAFDVVSRRAMLEGLQTVDGGDSVCRSFCNFMGPRLLTSEGGEQGDPLLPALFSLSQHPTLQAVQAQLQDGERLFAFLDDVHVVCSPPWVNAICGLLQHALFAHSSIRVYHVETQVWNRGVVPGGIEVLQVVARVNDPDAIVWRRDPTLCNEEQGVRILGTPLGHPKFVRSQLAALSETHDQLLEKVLSIQDLQCAWLLLLFCCSVLSTLLSTWPGSAPLGNIWQLRTFLAGVGSGSPLRTIAVG